jgi:hypothetical protein
MRSFPLARHRFDQGRLVYDSAAQAAESKAARLVRCWTFGAALRRRWP